MKSLPLAAKAFVLFIYSIALIMIVWAARTHAWTVPLRNFEFYIYVALGILLGGKKVRLFGRLHESNSGSMSVGFAITFATMIRFGPAAAMVVSALNFLSSAIFPKRQPLHQALFNVSIGITEAWIAGLVYVSVNGGGLELSAIRTFTAASAGSLCYFLLNTVPVAVIIALVTNQKPFPTWTQSFLWTAPSYFAGACVCAFAMLILKNNAGMVVLFISPVLYFTYRSYSIYVERAEDRQKHIEELAGLYLATIKSLALAIDAKDRYTHQHILRVQRYCMAVANHLNMPPHEKEGLNTGALLHDIGKLGVPEYVLLKPGRLTDEEFEKIKKHPEIGADILSPVTFPWPVLPVVKHHHERWDGTGYPDGLKGENIPLTARILAISDVYDALTSNRAYRSAWTHERAIETIKADSGTHFDPKVVEAFLAVVDKVVEEMRTERLAEEGDPNAVPGTLVAGKSPIAKAERAARHIQRATSELWALYEVAQSLSSSLGLNETIDILSRKLEAILPNTACVFMLKDERFPDRLVARSPVGFNAEFFRDAQTINEESLTWKVGQASETYCGEYDTDDILFSGIESSRWTEIKSSLIVPLCYRGEFFGTINLYDPAPEAFVDEDVQLVESIAERAAMALHNATIYDRTRTHAQTDGLTGLYNVRYVTREIEERCQNKQPFVLLCIDLDSFKPVNDNFGHAQGDEVLRSLSKILLEISAPYPSVVARYGGDEFLIVLDNLGFDEGKIHAENIERAVAGYDPGLIHETLGAIRLGASIGVAAFPEHGNDCASLISSADTEMYRNKSDHKLRNLMNQATMTDRRSTELPRKAA